VDPPSMPTLLAVPNVSEGRERTTIEAIGNAFSGAGARLGDLHSDRDHERSVYTLAGEAGALADELLAGARVVVDRIDIRDGRGAHPHIGALDVVPIVYLGDEARGAACAEALVVADRIGAELAVPVFLYGALGGGRTRAELRRGGPCELGQRMAAGELRADFGPQRLHERAGATLVAARQPLVAFNLELAPPATAEDARAIALLVRDGGEEGLPGVRAIGVALEGCGGRGGRARGEEATEGADEGVSAPIAQVSMNVEEPARVPLAEVVARVRRRAAVDRAEIVGLVPREALEGFPEDLQIAGFDPARQVIENVLSPS
jgi:glutamate formiminotransferase / 5-formyltetrahydrofolate cyclo-ligase